MFIESSTSTAYVSPHGNYGSMGYANLVGVGADAGLVQATCPWYGTTPVVLRCNRSANVFLPRLSFNGHNLNPMPFYVNGSPCWADGYYEVSEIGSHSGIWRSNAYDWVYSDSIGIEPLEYEIIRKKGESGSGSGSGSGSESDDESEEKDTPGDGYHGGDSFYTLNGSIGPNLTMSTKISVTPRGTGFGGTSTKKVAVAPPEFMWEYDAERSPGSYSSIYGVYKPVGGTSATTDVVVGTPFWCVLETGAYIYKSLKRTNARHTYGSVRYVDGKWAIGTPGSGSWWEGSEPETKVGSRTVFAFRSADGGKGTDRTLEFRGYTFGPGTTDVMFGQVPVWM